MRTTEYGTESARALQLSGETTSSSDSSWYAVWTRSRCEELVRDQLSRLEIEVFLPKVIMWQRRAGRRRLTEMTMFPGYLFVRHAMDKATQIEVLKSRGVVRLLGERWDRLSRVPDDEISAVRRMMHSGSRVRRHPDLHQGAPVRIISGPLEGLRGSFVGGRPNKGLFLIAVSLLQRSVAVEIAADLVEPL